MRERMSLFKNHLSTIGYGILVALVCVGFYLQQGLARQLEKEGIQRAVALCEIANENRTVIEGVLDSLAQPRADDEPGEHEERRRLFDQVKPLLERKDCEHIGEEE